MIKLSLAIFFGIVIGIAGVLTYQLFKYGDDARCYSNDCVE